MHACGAKAFRDPTPVSEPHLGGTGGTSAVPPRPSGGHKEPERYGDAGVRVPSYSPKVHQKPLRQQGSDRCRSLAHALLKGFQIPTKIFKPINTSKQQ